MSKQESIIDQALTEKTESLLIEAQQAQAVVEQLKAEATELGTRADTMQSTDIEAAKNEVLELVRQQQEQAAGLTQRETAIADREAAVENLETEKRAVLEASAEVKAAADKNSKDRAELEKYAAELAGREEVVAKTKEALKQVEQGLLEREKELKKS